MIYDVISRFYIFLLVALSVCNKSMDISEIIIDSSFTHLLQKYPDEEKCMVYPDESDSMGDQEKENALVVVLLRLVKEKHEHSHYFV